MNIRKPFFHILLGIAVMFIFVSSAFADGFGEVGGFVGIQGSGQAVSGATVEFVGGGTTLSTSTDNTGHYVFSNAPAGDATITASKLGVTTSPANVTVLANASVQAPDILFASGPGSPVAIISVPIPTSSCCGMSVGFDGRYVYYSNYSDNHLFAIEPDGTLVNTLTTGLNITAMAWDAVRQRMWAYNADDGFVYLVNVADGTSEKKFSVVSFDGLAYDASNDTIWSSPDASGPIYQYESDGTLIKTLSISFPNSGLAIGGSVLYAGSNGWGTIYKISKLTGEILSTFATPGGRDEDLECDNVSFSPRTVMWSKDTYNNTLTAFEVEPGTCIFGGAADNDGDGLPDEWEINGFDANGDGTPEFDLKALGADPNKEDVFIYVDWLKYDGIFGFGAHTHKPDQAAIDKVIAAFADQGISLHVIFGSEINEDNTNKELGFFTKNGDDCDYSFGELNSIRSSSFLANPAREPIFHYVLFGHDMGPDPCQNNGYHSGVSNGAPASDLLVTLGHWTNSLDQQAGTFMHELGHNLGLGHGGVEVVNGSFRPIDTNYKPNHLSIMNYQFQTDGLVKGNKGGIMDYLRFGPDVLPPLNENGGLNEKTGFGAGQEADGYGTSFWCPTDSHQVIVLNIRTTPIDWNCTSPDDEEGVTGSINQDEALQTLTSENEWTHLTYKGGAIGVFGVPYTPPETVTFTPQNHELTIDEDMAIMPIPTSGADTTGVFRPSNGLIFMKNQNTTGFADIALNYGLPGDYPVVGDWDGNGTTTVGIYRGNTFFLRNENTIGFATIVFDFGQVGDQPIAGDWDGDGVDTIGIIRPSLSQFMLRNSNDAGPAEMTFVLGNPGDVGIAGDWNGDGLDTTGVFRPSNGLIYLKDTNATGFADYALNYGIPGDKPVTGDWDGDGVDTIGVYRNGTFFLRNENTIGFATIVFDLGNPGDMPIAGNWDGSIP